MPNVDFPGAIPSWVSNYAARPPGAKIDLIVLHATAGPQPQDQQVSGTLAWFANPDSQVSSHYLIGLDDKMYQCVLESQAAWHANSKGLPDYNARSIGIELAQQAGHMEYTKPQLANLIDLLSWLVQRYGIARKNIVTHASLNPGKSDPLGWAAYNDKILGAVFDKTAPHKPAETPPDPDTLRKAAFDAAGIPFNPQAAFVLYARLHGLGAPMTSEWTITYANGANQISGQGFVGGIVWCYTGDWSNSKTLAW